MPHPTQPEKIKAAGGSVSVAGGCDAFAHPHANVFTMPKWVQTFLVIIGKLQFADPLLGDHIFTASVGVMMVKWYDCEHARRAQAKPDRPYLGRANLSLSQTWAGHIWHTPNMAWLLLAQTKKKCTKIFRLGNGGQHPSIRPLPRGRTQGLGSRRCVSC